MSERWPECDGFTNKLPDREGWWLWMEAGRDKPERLLIVGGGKHWEVATDDAVSDALGREIDEAENYWEMTDVKQMPGTWKFDGNADLMCATPGCDGEGVRIVRMRATGRATVYQNHTTQLCRDCRKRHRGSFKYAKQGATQ